MVRTREIAVSVVIVCALAHFGRGDQLMPDDPFAPIESANPAAESDAVETHEVMFEPTEPERADAVRPTNFAESLSVGDAPNNSWVKPNDESAKFPKAYQIPDTDVWWKFGGYVKGDFIHDFQPAGTQDRFVPITIPVDGDGSDNSLFQAKATRLNLDVRKPTDWGIARGFVEGDFFNNDNQFRIRHAYVEVCRLLAGQTWTAFTDPNSIPRTLDFESPIAFITLRQAQFRWTEPIGENLKWAVSVENPNTSVDDSARAAIPGRSEQPIPDFVTHLKYSDDTFEWFVAGLFRELDYRPEVGSLEQHFGWAGNLVGIVKPTDDDKIIAQFVIGQGLGRYRSGFDLGLDSPTTTDVITHIGACFAVTHGWTKKLSSTGVFSCALRRNTDADPPDAEHFATYSSINLIWEPIDDTTMGIEYLYGTNEVKDDSFGFANRIQASVQYNFP